MSKKLYTLLIQLVSSTLTLPAFGATKETLDEKLKQVAEGGNGVTGFFKKVAPGTGLATIAEFIGTLLSYLLGFLGVLFLLLIIYAGFRWMFARGNEDEVSKAQKIMVSSFQGLIVVVIAYALVKFVGLVIKGFINT